MQCSPFARSRCDLLFLVALYLCECPTHSVSYYIKGPTTLAASRLKRPPSEGKVPAEAL